MTERHTAMLRRLADAAERLAMKHVERALACDDAEIEVRATSAFHKAARCARQCAALEARLIHEGERFGREARSRADWAGFAATETRKLQLSAAAERLIWSEADDKDHAERLCDELDDLLEAEALLDSFATEDLSVQVTRICKALGIRGIEVLAVLPGTPGQPPDPQNSA